MKNQKGVTLVALAITIVVLGIIASVSVYFGKDLIKEAKIQDIRTNMLLIQAEAKKGLEEVCFNSVNLDKNKEEDLTKLNEIKQEYLEGIILSNAPVEVQDATKNIPDITFDDNCYYLDEKTLSEMGITDVKSNKFGYFIVKYDFTNADVEVINTQGHEGVYTLTQMLQTIEEPQS